MPPQNSMDELSRSPHLVPPDDFRRLFKLSNNNSWIQRKAQQDGLIELWNNCDNDGQRDLVENLIERFHVVNAEEEADLLDAMANQITNVWEFNGNNTYIISRADSTSNDDDADGSKQTVVALREPFANIPGWNENHFKTSFAKAIYNVPDNSNIVLIDDFVGTGKTISTKYLWCRKKLNTSGRHNVNVKVCVLAAMNASKDRFDEDGIDHDNNFYTPLWLNRGISDHYYGDDLEHAVNAMNELEGKLYKKVQGKKLEWYSFGFRGSEALFNIRYNNIPNNVFPIFWWPKCSRNSTRSTIFRRFKP